MEYGTFDCHIQNFNWQFALRITELRKYKHQSHIPKIEPAISNYQVPNNKEETTMGNQQRKVPMKHKIYEYFFFMDALGRLINKTSWWM